MTLRRIVLDMSAQRTCGFAHLSLSLLVSSVSAVKTDRAKSLTSPVENIPRLSLADWYLLPFLLAISPILFYGNVASDIPRPQVSPPVPAGSFADFRR